MQRVCKNDRLLEKPKQQHRFHSVSDMKICLDFYQNGKQVSSVSFHVPTLQDISTGAAVWEQVITGTFDDLTLVEATLSDFGLQRVDKCFKLLLAYSPDYESLTDKHGKFWHKLDNQVELLRGAAGISYLRLLQRKSAAPNCDFTEIALFRINVLPSPDKAESMRRMVDELVGFEPVTALSRRKGLSRTNIERRWGGGGGEKTLSDFEVKVPEMECLLKDIYPYLNAIRKNSAFALSRVRAFMPIDKIRHFGPGIAKEAARRAFKSGRVIIPTWGAQYSFELPVHCAIKDFLIRFKAEADQLILQAETSIKEDRGKLAQVAKAPDKSDLRYEKEDLTQDIDYKERFLGRLESLAQKTASLLADCYPWAQCRRGDIATLLPGDVPNNIAYKHVFFSIRRYRQKRFFQAAIQGRFDVPKYVRDNSSANASSWQKNYSAIYEAWTFLKLLEAFEREGFHGLLGNAHETIRTRIKRFQLRSGFNESFHATFHENADLEISLVFGPIAYSQQYRYLDPHFGISPKVTRDQLTPDFAIVFLRKSTKQFHWIVMDAKAWPIYSAEQKFYDTPVLNCRDKYLDNFLRSDDATHEDKAADQSWLVYAGPYRCKAGIEFELKHIPMVNPPNDPFMIKNRGLKWSRTSGVWGLGTVRNNAVGHIRANILGGGVDATFSEFARGQIATARRQLGL